MDTCCISRKRPSPTGVTRTVMFGCGRVTSDESGRACFERSANSST